MKNLKISTFILALAMMPLTNANATNIAPHVQKAETKVNKVMSDTMITAKIKEQLIEDPNLSALRIHVTTKNQVVTLTGKVNSISERNIAVNLAKSIKDVKSVKSKLKIFAA